MQSLFCVRNCLPSHDVTCSHSITLASVVAVLVLVILVFTRRRKPAQYTLAARDDDLRENVRHYDEEGDHEQDQDFFDINKLKKRMDESMTSSVQRTSTPLSEDLVNKRKRTLIHFPNTKKIQSCTCMYMLILFCSINVFM